MAVSKNLNINRHKTNSFHSPLSAKSSERCTNPIWDQSDIISLTTGDMLI